MRFTVLSKIVSFYKVVNPTIHNNLPHILNVYIYINLKVFMDFYNLQTDKFRYDLFFFGFLS